MSSPLVLSDLNVATLTQANDPSAILLMRVGLTDYQVAVSLIRNINIQALSVIPGGFAAATDKFIIGRVVGGNPNNYSIQFSQVGFLQGTQMWFYAENPPIGWTLIPDTGDMLLAVSDGVNQYNGASGGTQSGTWQQANWTLTPAQIPPHKHGIPLGNSNTNNNTSYLQGVITPNSTSAFTTDGSQNPTGIPSLSGQPHNHGNTWRPFANIGCLGVKSS